MKPREKEIDHLVEKYYRYDHETGLLYNKYKRNNRIDTTKFVGCINKKNNYLFVGVNGKVYSVHRIAWRLYYGIWPKHTIDHINGIRHDNRITNLRDVSHRVNLQNQVKHRTGHLLGTTLHKYNNKYRAKFLYKNKLFNLGYFETEIEAHQQYLKACKAIEEREFKNCKEIQQYIKKMK